MGIGDLLASQRDWLIPLGSVVVIVSAMIGLTRWWAGVGAKIQQLDADNEDAVANYRVNLRQGLERILSDRMPTEPANVEQLVQLHESCGAELRDQAPGAYRELRDLAQRVRARGQLQVVRWLPVALGVALVVLIALLAAGPRTPGVTEVGGASPGATAE